MFLLDIRNKVWTAETIPKGWKIGIIKERGIYRAGEGIVKRESLRKNK